MRSHQSAPKARQVAAAVIGNVLEWYDFIVFGLLTVVISRLFFPTSSQYASLLLTTATFGVGFFMRPVGGLLIRHRHWRGDAPLLLLLVRYGALPASGAPASMSMSIPPHFSGVFGYT
jgi:hypothetical protein